MRATNVLPPLDQLLGAGPYATNVARLCEAMKSSPKLLFSFPSELSSALRDLIRKDVEAWMREGDGAKSLCQCVLHTAVVMVNPNLKDYDALIGCDCGMSPQIARRALKVIG